MLSCITAAAPRAAALLNGAARVTIAVQARAAPAAAAAPAAKRPRAAPHGATAATAAAVAAAHTALPAIDISSDSDSGLGMGDDPGEDEIDFTPAPRARGGAAAAAGGAYARAAAAAGAGAAAAARAWPEEGPSPADGGGGAAVAGSRTPGTGGPRSGSRAGRRVDRQLVEIAVEGLTEARKLLANRKACHADAIFSVKALENIARGFPRRGGGGSRLAARGSRGRGCRQGAERRAAPLVGRERGLCLGGGWGRRSLPRAAALSLSPEPTIALAPL